MTPNSIPTITQETCPCRQSCTLRLPSSADSNAAMIVQSYEISPVTFFNAAVFSHHFSLLTGQGATPERTHGFVTADETLLYTSDLHPLPECGLLPHYLLPHSLHTLTAVSHCIDTSPVALSIASPSALDKLRTEPDQLRISAHRPSWSIFLS